MTTFLEVDALLQDDLDTQQPTDQSNPIPIIQARVKEWILSNDESDPWYGPASVASVTSWDPHFPASDLLEGRVSRHTVGTNIVRNMGFAFTGGEDVGVPCPVAEWVYAVVVRGTAVIDQMQCKYVRNLTLWVNLDDENAQDFLVLSDQFLVLEVSGKDE